MEFARRLDSTQRNDQKTTPSNSRPKQQMFKGKWSKVIVDNLKQFSAACVHALEAPRWNRQSGVRGENVETDTSDACNSNVSYRVTGAIGK